MPIVPQTGQLSVSNLKATANDSITRNVTTNVSLKDLRNIIIADGQPSPTLQNTGGSNISMSSFRGSQIMGILITTTPETKSTYGENNDGYVDVYIATSKFSTNSDTKIELVNSSGTTVATEYIRAGKDTNDFDSLNAGTYSVTVTDLGTTRSFTQTGVVVQYAGVKTIYKKNWS